MKYVVNLQIEDIKTEVSDYCRKELKKDPQDFELHLFRGDKECLTVPSAKKMAKWKIRETEYEDIHYTKYQPMSEKAKARLRLK